MSPTTQKSSILVVLPTLGKRNDLLRRTLESIRDQQPTKADIVMIFPLSNKETSALAKEFGATMVDDPHGMSAAVNAGIATAKPWHKYITWIGDDDFLAPESLQTTLKALEEDTDAVVAFGYCEYVNYEGKYIFTSRAGRFAPWIMTWGPDLVPMPGLLLSLDALKKVGEFDVKNKWSMDLDMLLRLRKAGGKFINTKKVLASFRWHETSQTVSNRSMVLQETELVKRKYLSKYLRPLSPIWELPVRAATRLAAGRVTKMAKKYNS